MNQGIYWPSFYFLLFAGLACGFSLAVVFTSNIVRMAFFLTLSLGATSGLFFLAGAEFVGAMQLMIYVGGTLVLLVFGVMLTSQERFISMKTSGGDWVVAAVVGGSLLYLLGTTIVSVPEWQGISRAQAEATPVTASATPIGMSLTGVRPDKAAQEDESLRDGMAGYLMPFEIMAIHLLVVLVGAAYLARPRRSRAPVEEETREI